MSILNELQVGLVSLLQTLQQQLVLGPLQLQLPYLADSKGDSLEDGRVVPQAARRSLPALTVTPSHHSQLPPAPHLRLQVCQPGLTLQQLGLELGSATLKLRLSCQQLLLVSCAGQRAPCQGLREQGL